MTASSFQLEGIEAATYAEPSTVQELAERIAECRAAGEPVFVFGRGSRLRFGNEAMPYSVALSTRRLEGVVSYSPEDLVIAVEPGVTISQLRAVLGEHGQHLAIDVAEPEFETIGGVFASGLSGPRRLLYGSLKDSTLGIEVAGPDGAVTKAGGMVVKNVTGYDLTRLHYGALGAFGAITRLNFKVLPAPERTIELTATFDNVEDAHLAAVTLLQSSLVLTALFLTWDGTHEQDDWRVHALLSGSDSTLPTQAQRVTETMSGAVRPGDVVQNDTDDQDLQSFRPFIDLQSEDAIVRISVPASNQAHFSSVLVRAGARAICADLGSGLVYARAEPTIEWRESARRVDGRAVFLSLPSEMRNGVDVLGGEDGAQEGILRRLKQEYDPAGTLNRGRFVLGL